MTNPDAQRWNARYIQERNTNFEQPRLFLIEQDDILPSEGLALDLAMGLGGNAGFLLQRGLRVIGVDVSEVAVRLARSRHPALMATVADLNRFYLPKAAFNVILNFYYLQRDLWPRILEALRPGGLLIYETLLVDMRSIHPEIDPQYLLEHDELRQAFKDMQILVYREGWVQSDRGHSRAVASLVARKELRRGDPPVPDMTCVGEERLPDRSLAGEDGSPLPPSDENNGRPRRGDPHMPE